MITFVFFRDGVPFCEKDYQEEFGVSCAGCGGFITGKVLQVSTSSTKFLSFSTISEFFPFMFLNATSIGRRLCCYSSIRVLSIFTYQHELVDPSSPSLPNLRQAAVSLCHVHLQSNKSILSSNKTLLYKDSEKISIELLLLKSYRCNHCAIEFESLLQLIKNILN